MSLSDELMAHAYGQLVTVCPKAPPGAGQYVDQITGYVQWGVLAIFGVAAFVSVGAVAGGRLFNMPHASKIGIISGVVVFIAAIGYMIFPAMLEGVTGSGCV